MVLVVHGDLIDTLLQGLLGSPCRFMHYNTAQSLLECTLTVECTLQLVGTEDFANTNAIRIIESTQSCGSIASQFSFAGLTNPSVQK